VKGGTTYTALAALYLVPESYFSGPRLTEQERQKTIRWLLSIQDSSGGFRGRTNKEPDTCYGFWCGASLKVLFLPTLSPF
jgi:geranylgeranyl transferase type-1 subunit beta